MESFLTRPMPVAVWEMTETNAAEVLEEINRTHSGDAHRILFWTMPRVTNEGVVNNAYLSVSNVVARPGYRIVRFPDNGGYKLYAPESFSYSFEVNTGDEDESEPELTNDMVRVTIERGKTKRNLGAFLSQGDRNVNEASLLKFAADSLRSMFMRGETQPTPPAAPNEVVVTVQIGKDRYGIKQLVEVDPKDLGDFAEAMGVLLEQTIRRHYTEGN